MTTTITTGSQVICDDEMGHEVEGIVLDVQLGACRGGGLASVRAVWPGRKRASARLVELAFVKASA